MQADWRAECERALLLLLREKRPSARAAAADSLCELLVEDPARGPELLEHVPTLLADAQPEVRRAGLELAARALPPEEAMGILSPRLLDPAPEVRTEAAGRIADQARPEIRAPLAAALEDDAFQVRFEAARGMAAVRHSAGLEVLVEALRDHELRYRSLGALAELGDARALPHVRAVFRKLLLPPFERTQAAGALAKLGDPEGATHLLARTRKRWTADRALAVELCGEVKAAGGFERLSELVQDPKEECRGAAARGLGRFGDLRALPLLGAILQDEGAPEELRLDAADGLCRLGTAEARALVTKAVGHFHSPEAQAELHALLDELEPAA